MKHYFIEDRHFGEFIQALMHFSDVYAPIAIDGIFSFEALETPAQLRLDYDVTQLPPKKLFFPPSQALFHFRDGQFHPCLESKDKIVLGVHPYDLEAIRQLDIAFSETFQDIYYTQHRQHSILIGSEVIKHSPHAFWSSVSKKKRVRIEDGFLYRVENHHQNGYLYEVLTEQGRQLLKFGCFTTAAKEQINSCLKVPRQFFITYGR